MPKIEEDKQYGSFRKSLDSHLPLLKDKARLYYYSQKLNEKLREKNPAVYDELTSKYGWSENTPLANETRIKGADEYATNNPDFYLTPDEQKILLDKNWEDYAALRAKYGKDFNLAGVGDEDNPEQWKYGARHSVAFNPTKYTYESIPAKGSIGTTRKFKYKVAYDPAQEGQYVENIDYDPNDESKAGDNYIGYLQGKNKNFM